MTSIQSIEVYSDSSCKSVVSLTIISTGTCSTSDCMLATIAGNTYYTATSCPSEDVYEHTKRVYEDTDYLLMDLYKGEDCNTYIGSKAFTASGVCEVADVDGKSVIATLFSNGSAQLTYYLDGSCTIPSVSFLITKDDVSSHTCLDDRKYYLRSVDAATNGNLNDGSSRLSGGAIAGIIGGVLLVLVLVVVLVYRIRQLQRRLNQDESIQGFRLANGDAYEMQFSPTKHRSYATTTNSDICQLDSHTWDDDVIIAARIPRAEVKVVELINRGGYGEVYMGSYHGKQVAVKMLLPEKKKTMSQVNAFLSEIKLMASLDHPRIVSFIGVAWDQLLDICAVCEYMAGGDLKALITEFDNQKYPVGFDHAKVKIALHVSIALTYLHSCSPSVIHRDLKSKNILLDEAVDAKVTDFGISRERIDATMTGGIGTSFWMAPEIMMGERYDEKADMFSFGVVLSELDSHVLPYALSKSNTTLSCSSKERKLSNAAILQMVAAGELCVHFSEACPQSMVELGLACVSLDPKNRPTAAEAQCRLEQILAKEV
ncbi:unnamed protein product [Peronospora farinosa]|uniref:Protein kinase domain-containing protein n=1 Tax=Peronospora farinosa TaxID=134698 RepID=A0AAV0UPR4_9STRA|nr:unnamed protein product [Peronospora farinosa]CAI5738854.1 unnamed protein product [Peronospora farinosa]